MDLQGIKTIAEARDRYNVLDPMWSTLDAQIRESMAKIDDDYVCVIKTEELTPKYLDTLQKWNEVEHIFALALLCKHALVEYNYDYIQIVLQITTSTDVYEYHPNDIPIQHTLSGNYIFKDVFLSHYHLYIRLEEKNA